MLVATGCIACFPACQQSPSASLGTTPTQPVSSDTDLTDNSLAKPDTGVQHLSSAKIDTGIQPGADKKGNH